MTEQTMVADLLHQVAAHAAAKLPATLHERLGTARALVAQGAVVLDEAGRYSVHSEEDPTRLWPVNGVCTCPDATSRAPGGLVQASPRGRPAQAGARPPPPSRGAARAPVSPHAALAGESMEKLGVEGFFP